MPPTRTPADAAAESVAAFTSPVIFGLVRLAGEASLSSVPCAGRPSATSQGGAVAAKAEADVIAKAGPGPPLHPPLPVPGNAHRKRALGREGSPVASHGQPRAAIDASRSAARQADQFNRVDNAAFAFVVNK